MIAIRVRLDDANNKHITVSAKSPHIKWEDDVTKILEGGLSEHELSPKNVQAQLTHYFVEDLGATLSHTVSADEVLFEVVQKAPVV